MLRFYIMPLLLLAFLTSEAAGVTIEPDNPNYQYSGRIDFSNPKAPMMFWPGTSIRATFQGAVLKIILNDAHGKSFYSVFIDNDFEHPFIIECEAGEKVYDGPAGLTDDAHTLLLFRRTEASTGPTIFLGLDLKSGQALLEPPARPERRIEFYGNSITCGMGNEAPDSGDDDKMAEENNFLSYAAITARNLEAEYSCIAKSGIGILISWFDLVMPDYYYRLDPENSNSRWNFANYNPDAVIVNLFQNDSWLIKNLDPVPDSAAIVSAYIDFIGKIRSEYAEAKIFCTLGSMDATKSGSPWPGYIESAVVHKRAQGDENIEIYFFPFKNWSKHPRVRHHKEMADCLTQFVGVKMGWIPDDSTAVGFKDDAFLPDDLKLTHNFPNPFNPATVFEFTANQSGRADILVYNAQGRLVREEKVQVSAGRFYSANLDLHGETTGVYLYGVRMPDNSSKFQKMLLLK